MGLSLDALFPYITLGVLTAGLFFIRSRKAIAALLAGETALAFAYGVIDPKGLLFIAVFWGMCTLHWRNPSSLKWLNSLRLVIIIVIAISFAIHLVPGFYNLRVFSGILISPSAMPFTMYFNFDKTIAAVVLVASSGLLLRQIGPFGWKPLTQTAAIAALGVLVLVPLALASGYVNFDPKFPPSFWLWAFNNLYFVCFAEEVIFRGMIQNHLMQLAKDWKISPYFPIGVSALLFGLLLPGHFQGGPLFIAFAALSGLFYGYAYHRTNRLESAILAHFIVNLCHFLLFSYPLAASFGSKFH